MKEQREKDNAQHNAIYYNQILRSKERNLSRKKSQKKETFAHKEVDFKKYLIVPEGYEFLVYSFYFICIPYVVGLTFLFFYVAQGAYDNFSLMDLSSFLIIWAIGYEITAAIILVSIFISYIKFLKNSHK